MNRLMMTISLSPWWKPTIALMKKATPTLGLCLTDDSFRPVKYATQLQGKGNNLVEKVISYTRPEQVNKMGTQCYLFRVSSSTQGDGATGGYRLRIYEVAAPG